MRVILLYIMLCGFLSVFGQSKTIEDGIYKIDYDDLMLEDSELEVTGSSFIIYTSTDTINGTIDYSCDMPLLYFDIVPEIPDSENIVALLQSSFGVPVIEILEMKRKKLLFRTTCSGQLHITINTGRIIKAST